MKNTLIISLIALISLFLESQKARADIEFFIHSKTGATDTGNTIQNILKHDSLAKSTLQPIFSPAEKKSLQRLNQGGFDFSLSLKAKTQDLESFQRLQRLVQKKKLPLVLEISEALDIKTFSDPLLSDPLPSDPLPSDPLLTEQWGLQNNGQKQKVSIGDYRSLEIQARAGEDVGVASAPKENMVRTPIVVAVLDTGFDLNHPDLKNQFVRSEAECKNLTEYKNCLSTKDANTCNQEFISKDADQNGYPMDCQGWSVVAPSISKDTMGSPILLDRSNSPTIKISHGTHVTGIIAAQINGVGTQGVAQNVKILPVQVINVQRDERIPKSMNDNGKESTLPKPHPGADIFARGLLYAMVNHAQVINMSFGWVPVTDSLLMRKFVEMAQSKGIIIVAAAGNDSTDATVYPCAYPGVICVGSHDPDGKISYFSNYGSAVDVAAPGVNILSTWPMDHTQVGYTDQPGYDFSRGTSMAAPFVTGVMARLLNAGFSKDEAYSRMMLSARPSTKDGRQNVFTLSGNIDLAKAFQVKEQPLILPLQKQPVPLLWNQNADLFPVRLALKNYWSAARNVKIRAKLLDRLTQSEFAGAQLTQSEWSLETLSTQQATSLDTQIRLLNKRANSELTILLEVTADQMPTRFLRIQAELVKILDLQDQNIEKLTIENPENLPLDNLMRVTNKDGRDDVEYVSTVMEEDGVRYLLLKEDVSKKQIQIAAELVISKEELGARGIIEISRIDANLDGKSDYVFVMKTPPVPPQLTGGIEFHFFDERLKPILTPLSFIESEVKFTPHMWVKAVDQGVSRLLPAWAAKAKPPPPEQPKLNPWKPKEKVPFDFYFYYLTSQGLKTLKAPEGYYFITLLNSTKEQMQRGQVSVLMAKEKDRANYFAVADLDGLKVVAVHDLVTETYRSLFGIQTMPVFSLDQKTKNREIGTGFGEMPGMMNQKVSVIAHQQHNYLLQNYKLMAPELYDPIRTVSGIFVGNNGVYSLGLSKYEAHLYDHKRGQKFSINIQRYTAIAGKEFDLKLVNSAVIEDTELGVRLPGLFVFGVGSIDSISVITPRLNSGGGSGAGGSHGEILSLTRPAAFKIQAPENCMQLRLLNATADHPTQIPYLCGNQFVRVPLKY